jgi:predicted N-acyltransferase
MSYSIHTTIGQCNSDDWDELVHATSAGAFMSRAFVAAVEEAFANQARFGRAIIRDADRAVACASLCAFPIDIALLTQGYARQVAKVVDKMAPFMTRSRILFCGLPVSVGAKHLAIASDARHEDVLRTLHATAVSFAQRERADFIVFKEFADVDCKKMDFLGHLGYRRFSSPAMNIFPRRFPDFASYCAALRSRHRQTVRRSLSKAREAHLRYVRLTDTDEIIRLYTPDLHKLYEAVALSSETRLELLPPSFFHSLARRLPGQVGLTLVYADDRVLAFNWNLFDDRTYHFLFAGLDYEHNGNLDLYFNLVYTEMDYAFRAGAETLIIGQTADAFKLRLGCIQEPLSFYICPVGITASLVLRLFAKRLFPAPPPTPIYRVFSDADAHVPVGVNED